MKSVFLLLKDGLVIGLNQIPYQKQNIPGILNYFFTRFMKKVE